MFTCLDWCSLHALCHHLCAWVLHAMFMCLGLDLVCHAMCYCSHFVPFIAFFLCVFGLMVRTWSGPYGICHRPYTKAHIKGFGSSYLYVDAGLLLCFMLVLASSVLGVATFDTLSGFMVTSDAQWPCFGVTIWDVSPGAGLFRVCLSLFFLLHTMICLPCLFVPPVGFLCIFTHLLIYPCMSLAC